MNPVLSDKATPGRPFTFTGLGGTSEIGASSYLITIGPHRVLVDAGARPSRQGKEAMPNFDLLADQPPTSIVLTHAHLDHVGMLPELIRRYPRLRVYCTQGTRLLTEHTLNDSLKTQYTRARLPGGARAAFTARHVRAALEALEVRAFHEPFSPEPGVQLTFYPAGHLPGAAQVMIEALGRRVLVTGDISNVVTSLTDPAYKPVFAPGDLDAMITESTYGDTTLPARKTQVRTFVEHVWRVTTAGGKVLIPSFALGRSQELALLLAQAVLGQRVPPVPIYLDGGTRNVTDLLEQNLDVLPERLANVATAGVPAVLTMNVVQRVASPARPSVLRRAGPAVVIASSGMLNGGVSPIYARAWLGDPNNALMVVGHQDPDTPGGRLLRLETDRQLRLQGKDGQLETVPVAASITRYYFSGHADKGGLVSHVNAWQPRRVVLVHGEIAGRRALYRALTPGISAVMPENGETVSLDPQPITLLPKLGASRKSTPVPVKPPPVPVKPPPAETVFRPPAQKASAEGVGRVVLMDGVPTLVLPLPDLIPTRLVPDATYRIELQRDAVTQLQLTEIGPVPEDPDDLEFDELALEPHTD